MCWLSCTLSQCKDEGSPTCSFTLCHTCWTEIISHMFQQQQKFIMMNNVMLIKDCEINVGMTYQHINWDCQVLYVSIWHHVVFIPSPHVPFRGRDSWCLQMDFLRDEDVMTDDLRKKASRLSELKKETAEVDCDIESLETEISTIQTKRKVLHRVLDRNIRKQRTKLNDRLRRKRKLTSRLSSLQVKT